MRSAIIFLCACSVVACNNAGKPVPQNSTAVPAANERPQTAIAHSSENQTAPSGEKSKWTQSGDAIDTKKFDAAIAAAEVAYKKTPNDEKAKTALAEAYLERANALTGARQYASALGDYRRALKYDPSNEEAKEWIGQIVNIYDSINRAYPKEGEEPPPLPYKGGKDEK
jgi:tetratricopeptide (TPR) repeat protein